MLRGIQLVVLALSVAVVAGYIEIYVEGGPDLDGLHIYAWDGGEWVPVGVIYVPEYIDTYIVAGGQWASMPYYNMSRIHTANTQRGPYTQSTRRAPRPREVDARGSEQDK